MCRFAAYLGPELPLGRFLLEPDHSLVRQSWQPREMQTAMLNADGFGVGWYNGSAPATYRQMLPIWADPNLADLGNSLARRLWLAHVRSATPGYAAGHANTQPFADAELLFVHNGFVTDFAYTVRPRLRRWLRPEIEAGIHGGTDTEYLFAVVRQLLAEDPERDLTDALRLLHTLLLEWGAEQALLSMALSDGARVVALRHAIGCDCPSLYFTADDDLFPDAQLVASEPLTEIGFWQAIPPHHLLVLDEDEPPQLLPL